MKKIEASVQFVSVSRIGSIYLIGVLYDFESDNQEGSLDVIVQGNNISFSIEEPEGEKNKRSEMYTVSISIVSETGHIPVFNVNKGNGTIITVPVFSPQKMDYLKIASELSPLSDVTRGTLSIVPRTTSGLPTDITVELDRLEAKLAAAREWGWSGW